MDDADTPPLATMMRKDGYVEARLTRATDHSPAELWAMLTQPARIAEWLAPGEIELRVGGRARLDFADSGTVIDSTVTAFEDGRVLEYSWSHGDEPHRPVRWEVTPEGDGARLDLTLLSPAGEDAGRACAGWEAHLEMLEAALEGVPIKFPFERFKTAREAYRAVVAGL